MLAHEAGCRHASVVHEDSGATPQAVGFDGGPLDKAVESICHDAHAVFHLVAGAENDLVLLGEARKLAVAQRRRALRHQAAAGCAPHLPWKTGRRFSRKANIPSR